MQITRSRPRPLLLAASLSVTGASVFAITVAASAPDRIIETSKVAAISLAYVCAGAVAFSSRSVGESIGNWVLPAGLSLAALEITNIWLEQFVGLSAPANAIIPASMMGIIVLFASTSAVVASAGYPSRRGVISAVIVVAVGMIVACLAALGLALRAGTTGTDAL